MMGWGAGNRSQLGSSFAPGIRQCVVVRGGRLVQDVTGHVAIIVNGTELRQRRR